MRFPAALALSLLLMALPALAEDAPPRSPWPNQSGEFCAMLTLISEDNLKEFANPSDQPVDLHELDKAKHGDHIAAKLTFTGMDITSDQLADVTYDFRVIPPGGFGALENKGLPALKDKVSNRYGIYDNQSAPIIVFDPEYPLGIYTFIVVVTDNIGHRSLSMSKEI